MNRFKTTLAIIINLAVFILSTVGNYIAYSRNGNNTFYYYTQLSNIFLAVASLIYAFFLFKELKDKDYRMPQFIRIIKYMATSIITVTFFIVMTVLAPMALPDGIDAAIHVIVGGSCLYQHLFSPVLSIASFIFLEGNEKYTVKDNILAIIPTLAYAIILVYINIVKIFDGPYPFLRVHNQPVWASAAWFVVILSIAYVLAFVLRRFQIIKND